MSHLFGSDSDPRHPLPQFEAGTRRVVEFRARGHDVHPFPRSEEFRFSENFMFTLRSMLEFWQRAHYDTPLVPQQLLHKATKASTRVSAKGALPLCEVWHGLQPGSSRAKVALKQCKRAADSCLLNCNIGNIHCDRCKVPAAAAGEM